MLNSTTIDQLAQSISDMLPTELISLKEDAEKNLKALLQQKLSQLDLVGREEFDAQQAVLVRTRIKLEELEKTLKTLEKTLSKR
jgi:hypothetical protein